MQEKSQISQRKIGGWNAYKMFKMTKTKPCDKRILSPSLWKSRVENRVSSAEKGKVVELSSSFQNVFSTSCGEKSGAKWRYFVAIGEKPHILGDIWCTGSGFSTNLVRSVVDLSEWGTVFHRRVEKEKNGEKGRNRNKKTS